MVVCCEPNLRIARMMVGVKQATAWVKAPGKAQWYHLQNVPPKCVGGQIKRVNQNMADETCMGQPP